MVVTYPSILTQTVGRRSVWVVALFGKGAPPALRTVSDGEAPWTPLDDEEEEGSDEEGEN